MSNISKSKDSEEITYIVPKMINVFNQVLDIYRKKLPKKCKIPDDVIERIFDDV
jgi:hypothetical protein